MDVDPKELVFGHDWVEDDRLIFLLDILKNPQSFHRMAVFEITVEVALERDHEIFMLY